jgi:hypothetical protein
VNIMVYDVVRGNKTLESTQLFNFKTVQSAETL